jgi:hypothetical protein
MQSSPACGHFEIRPTANTSIQSLQHLASEPLEAGKVVAHSTGPFANYRKRTRFYRAFCAALCTARWNYLHNPTCQQLDGHDLLFFVTNLSPRWESVAVVGGARRCLMASVYFYYVQSYVILLPFNMVRIYWLNSMSITIGHNMFPN